MTPLTSIAITTADDVAFNSTVATTGNITHPTGTGTTTVSGGTIAGLPLQGFYDPSLATLDGQLHLLATIGNDIAALPLDLNTRTVGAARVLARVTTAGRTANSAQAIVDANQDMVGLSFHELESFGFLDNDQWIAADLDPATPALRVVDSNDFFSNGTFVGGRYISSLSDATAYRLVAYEAVRCTGGRSLPGTTMSVLAFAPPRPTAAWLGYLVLSAGFVTPVSLPFAQGELGIDPASLVLLPMGAHDPASGQAALLIPIPNVGSLRGRHVPAQSVAVDANSMAIVFGNTCALTVR